MEERIAVSGSIQPQSRSTEDDCGYYLRDFWVFLLFCFILVVIKHHGLWQNGEEFTEMESHTVYEL